MGSDKELIRLEQYIERLLSGYAELKKEKQNIETRFVELQTENEKYKQELDSLDSDRGLMRDRVNSLIGQIEQWEMELEEVEGSDKSSADEGQEDDSEEDAEDEEPPAEKKKKADRGGKAQKKLFSG